MTAAAAAVAPPRPVPAVAGAAANLRRRRRDGFCSLKRGRPLRRSRACATCPRHYPPPDPRFCRRTIVHLWDAHAALKPGGARGVNTGGARKGKRGGRKGGLVGGHPSSPSPSVWWRRGRKGLCGGHRRQEAWRCPPASQSVIGRGTPAVFFSSSLRASSRRDTACVPARNQESGTCARRQRQEARRVKQRNGDGYT